MLDALLRDVVALNNRGVREMENGNDDNARVLFHDALQLTTYLLNQKQQAEQQLGRQAFLLQCARIVEQQQQPLHGASNNDANNSAMPVDDCYYRSNLHGRYDQSPQDEEESDMVQSPSTGSYPLQHQQQQQREEPGSCCFNPSHESAELHGGIRRVYIPHHRRKPQQQQQQQPRQTQAAPQNLGFSSSPPSNTTTPQHHHQHNDSYTSDHRQHDNSTANDVFESPPFSNSSSSTSPSSAPPSPAWSSSPPSSPSSTSFVSSIALLLSPHPFCLVTNPASDRYCHRESAIVASNLALVHHHRGVSRGLSTLLPRALKLYQMSYGLIQHGAGFDTSHFVLALLNNMGQIHFELLEYPEAQHCLGSLKGLLANAAVLQNLDDASTEAALAGNELRGYLMNIMFLRPPHMAAAA